MLFQNTFRYGPLMPSGVVYALGPSGLFCSWFMPIAWPISWAMLPMCLESLHQPRFTVFSPSSPGYPTLAEQDPSLVMVTLMQPLLAGFCWPSTNLMHVLSSHILAACLNAFLLTSLSLIPEK
jgi:hypothetical protein